MGVTERAEMSVGVMDGKEQNLISLAPLGHGFQGPCRGQDLNRQPTHESHESVSSAVAMATAPAD